MACVDTGSINFRFLPMGVGCAFAFVAAIGSHGVPVKEAGNTVSGSVLSGALELGFHATSVVHEETGLRADALGEGAACSLDVVDVLADNTNTGDSVTFIAGGVALVTGGAGVGGPVLAVGGVAFAFVVA